LEAGGLQITKGKGQQTVDPPGFPHAAIDST